MKSYKQNQKTFTALQWTGDNVDEFDKKIQCSIDFGGALEVSYWSKKKDALKTLVVPLQHYLVIPSYGKMRVLNEAEFEEEFSEI